MAANTTPDLFNVASSADPLYATFVATIDAFAFDASTHILMFNDPGPGAVGLVQLAGASTLSAADIKIYAN